ncbi:alpha/beta hydrolase [Streptomyces sp. NPDC051162]|uniref:alpha/beta hydrolase n=1 Tax=Streptomyces sp. NPDC051162 TaxID=3154747 RepID=UPI003427A696
MVTIDELTKLDRSKFTKAAEAWSKVSNRASAAKGRVESEMLATLDRTQKGDAATKSIDTLTQLNKNYQYIHAECGLIRTALSGLAEELEGPQNKLKQALKDAEDLQFTVNPDGSVKFPPTEPTKVPLLQQPARAGGLPLMTQSDPNQAKAQEIADRISTALQDAAEIDGRYATALRKLNTNGKLDQTDWADVARDMKDVRAAAGKHFSEDKIPKGKSPKENADWWAKRTQAEKDEYVALHPELIGALDGLPSTVRDGANRVVLLEQYGETKAELAALEKEEPWRLDARGLPTAEWLKWSHERDLLDGAVKGMDAIQQRFDQTGKNGLPEAYLLSFDTKGRGHAVIANGNPDTATHTAVYVPGTEARLGKIGGDVKRMTDMWLKANSMAAPSEKVSTITWLGYIAPKNAHPFSRGELFVPSAGDARFAENAAPDLNSFLGGMREVQGGADRSHTTVIGHSYGSTVIGAASIKGGLGADDIIADGSPGMLVKRADDLDAPKGHVWSQAASLAKDQVPLGGRVVGLGGPLMIVPSDRGFGANIMKSDAEGHGDYFNDGSVSLRNQAAIVVQRYDKVQRD